MGVVKRAEEKNASIGTPHMQAHSDGSYSPIPDIFGDPTPLPQKWSHIGPKMIKITPNRSQNRSQTHPQLVPKLVPTRSQNGPKTILKWSQIGPKIGPKTILKWSDNGPQFGPKRCHGVQWCLLSHVFWRHHATMPHSTCIAMLGENITHV